MPCDIAHTPLEKNIDNGVCTVWSLIRKTIETVIESEPLTCVISSTGRNCCKLK